MVRRPNNGKAFVRRIRRPTPFRLALLAVLLLAAVRLVLLPSAVDPAGTTREQARAQSVIDGDTFELADGRRVRMRGIDAPEMGFHGKTAEAHAEASTAWLRARIAGEPVTLVIESRRTDRYGRTLAWVYDPRGDLINQASLAAGMARLLDDFGLPPELEPQLRHAEATARVQRIGIWQRRSD